MLQGSEPLVGYSLESVDADEELQVRTIFAGGTFRYTRFQKWKIKIGLKDVIGGINVFIDLSHKTIPILSVDEQVVKKICKSCSDSI
jgi:hypothetical protein